jgi:hypothetical protein
MAKGGEPVVLDEPCEGGSAATQAPKVGFGSIASIWQLRLCCLVSRQFQTWRFAIESVGPDVIQAPKLEL